MNTIEDRVREALDESARNVPVDTTRLWRQTSRRLGRTRRRRSTQFGFLTPLAAVAAVSLAALGIPAGASALHLALEGPAVAGDPAPQPGGATGATGAATATSPRPSDSPLPASKVPTASPRPSDATGPGQLAGKGEYAWTMPPPKAWTKVMQAHDGDGDLVAVDFVRAHDGDFVLSASYHTEPIPRGPAKGLGMCWRNSRVSDGVGGGACSGAGVPARDPYARSNTWLTEGNLIDYPHYGGDGLTSPAKLQLSTGQASTRVARVDGIDTRGRHHQAKLVGADEGWPTLQYFIVVPDGVQLESYAAYDAAGGKLGELALVVD